MTARRMFRQLPLLLAFIFLGSAAALAQTPVVRAADALHDGRGQRHTGVALADLNNDGKPDLIVSNCGCDNATTIRVRLNNGDGTFGSPQDYAVDVDGFFDAYTVATGDFNHDGNIDVATVKSLDDVVVVLLGNGDGTLQPALTFPTGVRPYRVIVADIDGDTNLDLDHAESVRRDHHVLLGDGAGNFTEAPNSPFATGESGGSPTGVAAADPTATH